MMANLSEGTLGVRTLNKDKVLEKLEGPWLLACSQLAPAQKSKTLIRTFGVSKVQPGQG